MTNEKQICKHCGKPKNKHPHIAPSYCSLETDTYEKFEPSEPKTDSNIPVIQEGITKDEPDVFEKWLEHGEYANTFLHGLSLSELEVAILRKYRSLKPKLRAEILKGKLLLSVEEVHKTQDNTLKELSTSSSAIEAMVDAYDTAIAKGTAWNGKNKERGMAWALQAAINKFKEEKEEGKK